MSATQLAEDRRDFRIVARLSALMLAAAAAVAVAGLLIWVAVTLAITALAALAVAAWAACGRPLSPAPVQLDPPNTGEDPMATTTYSITGMTCQHCVSSVREEVSEIVGIATIDVDLDSGRLTVTGESFDGDSVRQAVAEAGYEVVA